MFYQLDTFLLDKIELLGALYRSGVDNGRNGCNIAAVSIARIGQLKRLVHY